MSNQSGVQAAVRAATSTTRSYNADWHALATSDSIAAGPLNQRLLAWVNFKLTASHTNLNGALAAYAANQDINAPGVTRWTDLNTLTL